jgi:hypothetical protein
MKDFGSPETWGMKVDQFLEDENLEASLIDDLVPGPLKDELKKDFDPQQETYEEYLKRKSIPMEDRPFNMAEGGRMKYGKGSTIANQLISLLGDIKPYQGATKIGESTKKISREPELAFMEKFLNYAKEQFGGNFSAAARSIGQNRDKIKGIFDRTNIALSGKPKPVTAIEKGYIKPEGGISYSETTTNVNLNQNYLKDLIKDVKPGFYNSKDLARILKIGSENKRSDVDRLTQELKNLGVEFKQPDPISKNKTYNLVDAVDKITEQYQKKRIKGISKHSSERLAGEKALDQDLYNLRNEMKHKLRRVGQDEDIYLQGAVEDVGHPISLQIYNKYPKLFKDSNVNKINTLVFQDPVINREVLQKTGYEAGHDKLFKELNNYLGKELSFNDVTQIKNIKKQMNSLHDKAIVDVKKASEEGVKLFNKNTGKTTLYKSPYFKGQENNIPRIDIKVPNVGEKFSSQNIYANMNKVNPANKVGYIDKINPEAKYLSDLSDIEKMEYKANMGNQYKESLSKFYSELGYSKNDIDDLMDAIEYGTESKQAVIPQKFDKGGPAINKIFGKLAKPLQLYFSPTSTFADYAIDAAKGELDLSDTGTRLGLEIEAAFAPELVRGTIGLTKGMKDRAKQKAVQRLLNLGLPTIKALKYARILSPIGIASLAGEGAYYFYKQQKELQELKEKDPEAFKKFMDSRVSDPMTAAEYGMIEDMGREGAMGGGIMRLGLKNGPDDPSKRKFMKTAVGLASLLPFGIGKLAKKKPVQKAIVAASEAAPRGWSWVKDNFWTVYNSVLKKGKQGEFTKKGLDVKSHNGVDVIEDQNQIRVRYQTDKGNTAETVYNKPTYEVDPETGKAIKIPGEFEEYQDVYRMGKDDYYKDFEEEIIDTVENVKKIVKD